MTSFDASSKIWSGPKVNRSEEDKLTFRQLLVESFRKSPEKVFQISDDEETKLTFHETELMSIRVCQNLRKFGIYQNEVVAVLLKNSTYAAPLVFGCFLNGTAVHSLVFLQGMSCERLEQSLNITKPKAIIVEDFLENTEMITQTIADMNLDCKVFTLGSDKKCWSANVYDVCELLKETKEEDKFE